MVARHAFIVLLLLEWYYLSIAEAFAPSCQINRDGILSTLTQSTTRCNTHERTAPVGRFGIIRRRFYDKHFMGTKLAASAEEDDSSNEKSSNTDGIDMSSDPRLLKVKVSRASGIDWGTDLSFSFVYVRGMDPSGSAAMTGAIEVGDQLCEVTPLGGEAANADSEAAGPINLIGAPFDAVMNTFAGLDKTITDMDMVFFRGTKEELKKACSGGTVEPESDTVTVTVVQNKGAKDETVRILEAPTGVNVRQLLVDNGINVYQSVTRWTNCKGKQLCGTCIVNMAEGAINTNRKSMDEGSTLRENPDSYRLSCVTFAYGDVTVETFPPIKASQWTR